ncbi:MAG: aspartate--tRNA ligase [Rhodospirillaceae bacterium]|nr:aspartate--tRNA ligase [Rhodospirillaceae bacterium]|tara:strand:- start:53805 stop:55577 length:1773 start_codon:yes stop_codon:yes gene_type:complete
MANYRTHLCNELRESDTGKIVKLCGWIHRIRDHGNLLFIDLRDNYGIAQCVVESNSNFFSEIESLSPETVISIEGKVVERSDETINTVIETGRIEVSISSFEILSVSKELPIQVFGSHEYPEDIRLKYRYLDLRRERMHKNIILRSDIISAIRKSMDDSGFKEFQTPILTASSPEGARDFLVPSRIHPGKFYALPQAPQIFKQLIMVSGFDKYFQIAPCFRDEDPRSDRSPGEFYQLDIEMSFVNQDDIFSTMEPIISKLFRQFSNFTVPEGSFPILTFADAMLKYGTDKPDLRIPIEIADVTNAFKNSEFQIFAKQIEKGSVVRAIPAPNAASQPRSFFDKMNDWARKDEGAAGLGYIIFSDEPSGPIAKNLSKDRINDIFNQTKLKQGDAVFFCCSEEKEASNLAGAARLKIAEVLDLFLKEVYNFCWIVDFPMYEIDEKTKLIDFGHNPFSMPRGGLESLKNSDPLEVVSLQYDLVCNGAELASGAIRNHDPDIMKEVFKICGYDIGEVKKRFGGLYNALHYGAPPHGGIAFGLERMIMLIANEPNLREVMLFPMNQRAEDLMMSAPAEVDISHLNELSIKTDIKSS